MTPIESLDVHRSLDAMRAAAESWYGTARFSYQTVPVNKLLSAIDAMSSLRLEAVSEVLHEYELAGQAPFGSVRDKAGVPHLGLLTERLPGGFLILDGTHRSRSASEREVESLVAMVIEPTQVVPPPAEVLALGDVRVVDAPLSPKFQQHDTTLFRPAGRWIARWRSILGR